MCSLKSAVRSFKSKFNMCSYLIYFRIVHHKTLEAVLFSLESETFDFTLDLDESNISTFIDLIVQFFGKKLYKNVIVFHAPCDFIIINLIINTF